MKAILSLGLALVFADGCTTVRVTDESKGYSEKTVQAVLRKNGVSSTVLRPKSDLRDVPPPGHKGFPILLEGKPGVRVELDRDYWALAIITEKSGVYMLNPKDEQSALVITIGESKGDQSDAQLAKEPGFTKISRHPGRIANEKVVWRSWATADHLYSDCIVQLPVVDAQDAQKYMVRLFITANTPERRKSLEDHLDSLRLVLCSGTEEKAPNLPVERTRLRRVAHLER